MFGCCEICSEHATLHNVYGLMICQGCDAGYFKPLVDVEDDIDEIISPYPH